jgi:hypothetical protein
LNASHIIWSGQACPFRRAGVYFGLSALATHEPVARWLLPRRGSAYPHGRVRVRPGTLAPLHYFAIRDPSAVRVIPVRPGSNGGNGSGPDDEFPHVSLLFPLERRRAEAPPNSEPVSPELGHIADLARAAAAHDQGAFVVTVGLRADREAEFHERLILMHRDLPYAELCERIKARRGDFLT